MHPILVTLPNGFSIHTYGVMTAVAYLVAVWGTRNSARRVGMNPDIAYDLALITVLGGLVGSRLEYARVHWDRFADDPSRLLAIRDGGLVFYGGLIVVLLGIYIYARKKEIKLAVVFDLVIPWLPLGHFFGRLGCLMAGCCHGAETALPWAITYSSPDTMAPIGVPVHPAQIYAMTYNLGLAGLLVWMRGRKRFDGQLTLVYLSIYPILRSLNELVRGDLERGWFLEGTLGEFITNAQAISLGVAIFAAALWALLIAAAPKKKKAA
jgi:phosphatidylglycerol:prolipoprotein diacylglycerol transferase